MAQRAKPEPGAADLGAAEIEEAARRLAEGESVRIAVRGRVYLCTSVDEVRAAQRGVVVPGAVRLDGGR
jgi:hypothetical protein